MLENAKVERSLRAPFTFSSARIPIGAEISFTRDESKKAKVVSDKKAEYMGKKYSLSALALMFLNELGYNMESRAGAGLFQI